MTQKHQNRLSLEKSPYLLQHSGNPVDWYPWGTEAFEKAKKEDKPIFLSIGYSTCHWCHVMEHESFEDPQIASILNEKFISIKVDREERPDIDGVYMAAVQAIAGQGGWPLSVFLTPDKEPFFGGTYFPPEARWGTPGFPEILFSIHNAWTTNREKVDASSQQLSQLLLQYSATRPLAEQANYLDENFLHKAFQEFWKIYDDRFGGFGHAPKFPSSHNISFLLRFASRTGNKDALTAVEHTLTQMADGGIYDQLGGGFHRYSTDEKWQIPHFEKMLYDQAMLVRTYLEAYQATKNEKFANVARETLDYVLRDMTFGKGAFFSAEDADSIDPYDYTRNQGTDDKLDKKEGSFYLWDCAEIDQLLSGQQADVFKFYFEIKPHGNAENDPHGEFTNRNVLAVKNSIHATAAHFKIEPKEAEALIRGAKKTLLDKRVSRPRPHLDDKILTDWNGLMISGFALAGVILKEKRYLDAAKKSAEFIDQNLRDKEGRLLHRYRDGESSFPANLDDYAFFIQALLDIYEADFNIIYLEKAISLAQAMLELFWDNKDGGFYFTSEFAEKLIFRQKEIYDGAIPSGNSIALNCLLRLYHVTSDATWKERAEILLNTFAAAVDAHPSAYGQYLSGLDFFLGPVREVVIAVAEQKDKNEFIDAIFENFLPKKIIICRPEDAQGLKRLVALSPFIEKQTALNGNTAVYVCQNSVCASPIQSAEDLRKILTNNI